MNRTTSKIWSCSRCGMPTHRRFGPCRECDAGVAESCERERRKKQENYAIGLGTMLVCGSVLLLAVIYRRFFQ